MTYSYEKLQKVFHCEECGKRIAFMSKRTKFCTRKCGIEYWKKEHKRRKIEEVMNNG